MICKYVTIETPAGTTRPRYVFAVYRTYIKMLEPCLRATEVLAVKVLIHDSDDGLIRLRGSIGGFPLTVAEAETLIEAAEDVAAAQQAARQAQVTA